MQTQLRQFLDNSESAVCVDELFQGYKSLLESYGYDRMGFAVVSDHPQLCDDALGLVESQNISEWAAHYLEQGYLDIDPIQHLVTASSGIFVWQDVIDTSTGLSKVQKRVFSEVEDAGLFAGATFSAHGYGRTKSSTLVASSDRNTSLQSAEYRELHFASFHMHHRYLELKKFAFSTTANPLSNKEKDVLSLIAVGKTKVEVGERLMMSTHTVDYHMRNIFSKLSVTNAAAATALAVNNRFISI